MNHDRVIHKLSELPLMAVFHLFELDTYLTNLEKSILLPCILAPFDLLTAGQFGIVHDYWYEILSTNNPVRNH